MGHVAKRSADAEPEADAAYLYGGYGYGAFGGAYPYGLGYNGFAGYPYGYPAVGYSAYYGKRSADAEPEADAYYGYYGYRYGGYRGYYGYPYRYGYYGKRSADAEPAVLAGASRVLTPPTPLIHNPPALPVAYAHPLAYAVNPLAYPVLAAPAPAEWCSALRCSSACPCWCCCSCSSGQVCGR